MIPRSCFSSSFVLALLGLASTLVTGCGVDRAALPSATQAGGLHGIIHGGPNPVVGATVNLYATTSGGYGAPATLLGTALTGNDGGFTFVAPTACTANQQAYVTAYGGDPGHGLNANYLLMAALGPCSTISSSTSIWMNEVTTVAAAYALRPFLSITSLGGIPTVNVGAPANNNASTGTCAKSASVTTGCVAAGLSHAFENALNLANSVGIGGAAPTGTAYTVAPSNSTGVVPAALINSLANSIEVCVNSGGVTGSGPCDTLFATTTPPVASPVAPTNTLQAMLNVAQYPALTPSNVTTLYNLPSGFTSVYQPALSSAPTDFSMAIVYSGVNVAGTIGSVNLTSGGTGYTAPPVVTISGGGTPTTTATATASLGIGSISFVPNTSGTCTTPKVAISGGGTPITAATATASATAGTITSVTITNPGLGYTSVPTVVFSGTGCAKAAGSSASATLTIEAVPLTNPGAGYTSTPTVTIATDTGTGAAATASLGTTSFDGPYGMALDANDDVYVGSQDQLGTTGNYSFLSAMGSNGATLFTSLPDMTNTAPRGLAPDTLGNLWITANNTKAVEEMNAATGVLTTTFTTTAVPFGLAIDKANNIWYGTPASTQDLWELSQATGYGNVTFTTPPAFTNAVRGIAIDANQNIWSSGFNAATSIPGVLPNTGTAAAPAYANAVTEMAASSGINGAGIALDSSSNAWLPNSAGLFEVVPTFSGTNPGQITGITPTATAISDNTTTPNYNSVDGSGNVWIPSNQAAAQNIVQYVPGTSTATSYSPCYAPAGGQTCAATSLSQPQRTQVDSTGSVWITSLSNGRIYQLLGTGSPTWPQLSLGAPGVMPQ